MLQAGDITRIEHLPDTLLSGLPPDDVQFLRGCIGAPAKIDELTANGQIVLEIPRGKDCVHFIWIDPGLVRKV